MPCRDVLEVNSFMFSTSLTMSGIDCKNTEKLHFSLERKILRASDLRGPIFYKYVFQLDFKVTASRFSSWVLGFSSGASLLVSFDICESFNHELSGIYQRICSFY